MMISPWWLISWKRSANLVDWELKDLHKDALKQERLKIKLEKQEQKKTIEINKKEEEKREPKKRGRKIKDVDVSDVINKLIQI